MVLFTPFIVLKFFFIIGIVILPNLLGPNGVWLVVPFAEIITMIIPFIYIYKYRKEYMYENIFNKRILNN